MVVSSLTPLKTLAKYRANKYERKDRTQSEDDVWDEWKKIWSSAIYGRWTHRLIPNVQK